MKTGIIGLGTGGHTKGIIEIIRLSHSLPIAGLIDPRCELWGKQVLGVTVLGDGTTLGKMFESEIGYFFVGVDVISDTGPRQRLFRWAVSHGLLPISAIHPRAIVSGEAKLGLGVQIFAGAIVNAGATLDTHAAVGAGAIIEHDCIVGAHAYIASGARLAGGVCVESGVHIGTGATVREGIHVGERAVIAAGAVVVTDVAPQHDYAPSSKLGVVQFDAL